jgi:hypothetical protein
MMVRMPMLKDRRRVVEDLLDSPLEILVQRTIFKRGERSGSGV